MLTRRHFSLAALTGLIAGRARATGEGGEAATGTQTGSAEADTHDMSAFPPEWQGSEQIVFLGYQGTTALDLVGPQYMMASLWGATVRVAAKTREPLKTDTGLVLLPDVTFDEVPRDLDVICVPGAISGALDAMEDTETIEFLADRGSRARYVTSVCTGTLLLGQAGLVDGYRVTSHWFTRPLMEAFGAIPVDERVVRDRNRITGAGVTAGIDFGLTLVREMRDLPYAQSVQLLAEYDPQPPFDAGTPDKAPAEVTQMMRSMFAGLPQRIRDLAAPR
ncbi:MAG: DJ-1/PfpI family protein [Pseudomonadota bacterium]